MFTTIMRAAGYTSTGVILALMLLTVSDVFMRYIFSRPIIGTSEITEIMMVCMLFAVGWAALEGRHVKVDIVMNRVAPRTRLIVSTITILISLVVYIILVWQGILSAQYLHKFGVSSSMLDIPKYPFLLVLSVSFACLCLAMLSLLIQRIIEAIKG